MAATSGRGSSASRPRRPSILQFEGDNPDEQTYARAGDATGLGDIMVRVKYNFFSRMGADSPPPLTYGRRPAMRPISSAPAAPDQALRHRIRAVGKFSPHLNVGYTFIDRRRPSRHFAEG